MVTAFVDMVGLLMVVPLLPFYALKFGGGGFVVGLLVSAYSVAQLLSAPLWGRVSDRYGRRPALLIGLGASAVAYVIFGFADSLTLLLVSRLVQGAGGGTVGVIQAYVADATEPRNRARALGWLSAATSVGVMVGPLLGSLSQQLGHAAPGLLAAGLNVVNMGFAALYLRESRVQEEEVEGAPPPILPRAAVAEVLTRPADPASRLIWIYAVAIGAFHGMITVLALFLAVRFGVDEDTIGYVYAYNGAVSVVARAGLLGRAVDRFGEARLSRIGQLLLLTGLALLPFTWRVGGVLALELPGLPALSVELSWVALAVVLALVPLGTAFTFPCVTALLSRVIPPRERGVRMGVQQSFGGVARVLGPIWAGWAFEALGTGVPFWTGALLVLGTLLLARGIDGYGQEAEERIAAVRAR